MATPEQIAELEAYYRDKLSLPNAKALAVLHQDKPLAALQGKAEVILARLMAGESLKQVAAHVGVSREALGGWLLSHAPEEWRMISSGKALLRHEDATEMLENAEDQLQATKGRELARIASWSLERMIPKLYGQPGKDQAGGINISITVDRSCDGAITVDQATE